MPNTPLETRAHIARGSRQCPHSSCQRSIMPVLLRDYETRSSLLLKSVGAWRYSTHASTDVWCCAYAVDDGPIEMWVPGEPVPLAFIEAARNPDWLVSAFNNSFERLIERHIMAPRYGWPEIPIERHRCLQASALSLALPASLSGVADALRLEQAKDQAGRRVMLQMSRPRKARAGEDAAGMFWLDDAERRAQLYAYCKQDVATERALYQRIGFLSPEEQTNWRLDATINDRGIHIDRKLLDAALKIAAAAQRAIGAELQTITAGAVTGVNATAKMQAWLSQAGCVVENLQKPTLQQALTRTDIAPDAHRVMTLRLDGAHAAAKKLQTMRNWMADDDRVRHCFRYHGASPGRFTSLGIQVQNMKRPGVKDMAAAIDAVSTGDLDHLRSRYPRPVSVIGDISRALVCAPAGRTLIIADFSGIESRVTAWISGQQSKLDQWANYDQTGDPGDEPYFLTGHKIFGLPKEQARAPGKTGDLAFGYMGGVGAWAKLAPAGDTSTEAEIKHRQQTWRRAHPYTVRFWHALDRAAKTAVRDPGKIVPCRDVALKYCPDGFLRMRLPNGRKIAYPFPKLKADKCGNTSVVFMDNQKGRWGENRNGQGAYGGTWVENLVQAIARDLFIEAMQRLEAAGYGIVLHAHDEAVAEVPADFGSIEDFTRIFTELPSWAAGLPVAAKARTGERWCKIKAASEPELQDEPTLEGLTEDDDEEIDTTSGGPTALASVGIVPVLPTCAPAIKMPEHAPHISLIDLVAESAVDGKIGCPFHDDSTPSLQLYADHFHCYGCGAHGSAVDWLMMIEGLDRDAAVLMLEHGPSRSKPRAACSRIETQADRDAKRRRSLQLWRQAKPIAGTLAERYLVEHRGINLAALPDAAASLRFHPRCPFGPGTQHPCLIALRRDVVTDDPVAIHRIGLTTDGQKIDRRALGSGGVVKLYPAGERLVVGEGIETTLAAATRISRWGSLLQPAWSATSSVALGDLPPIPGVERLIILVDNDANGAGQAAALRCTDAWSRAGRSVVRLTPEAAGRRLQRCGAGTGVMSTADGFDDGFDDGIDEEVTPPSGTKGQAKGNGAGTAIPLLGEVDAGDDLGPIPPRGWLLGIVFCRRFISSLIADGGVGKTAVRLAQLLSLATGRELTEERIFKRCRVLIVSLEDDLDELRRRLEAAMLHYGIKRADLKGWLFMVSPGAKGGKLMVLNQRGRSVSGTLTAKLARTIVDRKIDIVSLDPFVKTHSVEENNNSMIDDVVQILSDLAVAHDIAVDVPHHSSKGPADPGNANRGRGASSMKDAGRLVYTLAPMKS